MGKIRLFLSLNLEEDQIGSLKKDQAAIIDILGKENIRWEDPDKFHLTLRFLGDIDEDKIEPLTDTLERLKFDFEKVEFTTDKIDFFPNIRFPNILYAGLAEIGSNTETLVGFIDKVIYNFGIKPDKKFIPHITFGRFNKNKRRKIESNIAFNLTPLKIEFNSFFLMRSKLMPGGSEYEELSNFNFSK
ncbi:MAG: RNA 2',3'-cyclic phosphodiesterase [Ignavibacteria bacterium]